MEKATFRRLSDEDAAKFRPWHSCTLLKIGWIIILSAVLIKWITR